MKKLFLSLCCYCLLAGILSCDSNNQAKTTKASLRWTGPIAADGCGFFLDIDGQEYKPSNEEVIPEAFKTEDVKTVEITYEQLEEPVEYTCGMMPSRYSSTIKIIEVKPL